MLREVPAAAIARRAAPFFYALRERRRRLKQKNETIQVRSDEARQRRRRLRPQRLRDRVRAVSHRISTLGRTASIEAPQTSEPRVEADTVKDVRGDGTSDETEPTAPLCAQLLTQPRGGLKVQEKKPKFFKNTLEIERFVFSYTVENIFLVQQQYDDRGAAGRLLGWLRSCLRSSPPTYPVARRVERLFLEKNILKAEVYREASFLAKMIDDLALRDKVDIFRSTAAARMIRRLCGIEFALRPVTSEATLFRANWHAADELELPIDTATDIVGTLAIAEARRRISARRRLTRVLKKWRKPYGQAFSVMT